MNRVVIRLIAAVVVMVIAAVGYKARDGGVRRVAGRSDVVEVDKDDPTLAAATEEAKRRWPEWIAAWNEKKEGRVCAVLVTLRARGTAGEQMWMKVDSFSGRSVSGKLTKAPYGHTGKKQGDRVTAEVADVQDWMYQDEGGPMVGAFTEKAIAELMKQGK